MDKHQVERQFTERGFVLAGLLNKSRGSAEAEHVAKARLLAMLLQKKVKTQGMSGLAALLSRKRLAAVPAAQPCTAPAVPSVAAPTHTRKRCCTITKHTSIAKVWSKMVKKPA